MKRYGNIYDQIATMENLQLAHQNAKRGKNHYTEVQMVDANPEYYLAIIREQLINKTYRTSPYVVFAKNDKGKEREIYKLPYFPDRIVHHAIMNVLEPYFMRHFIYDTYAAMKGRGIHLGLRRLHEAMKDREATRYCLKLDVKKFFPSVHHETLKELLAQKFKDGDLLWLLGEIIDSVPGETNVPIGNYLSQYFCNFYLSGFDHWIKEVKREKNYFRYMDDMVILSGSKAHLHALFREIRAHLDEHLRLTIKGNWQVFPTYIRGVDFLGYRSFGDYTLLRKSTAKAFKRKMRVFQRLSPVTDHAKRSMASYGGWIKWCNGFNLSQKYMKPILERRESI